MVYLRKKDIFFHVVCSQLRKVCHLWTKCLFFSYGFYWRRKGAQADQSEIVSLPVAPHSSFCDAVIICLFKQIPYAISRAENLKLPFMGGELALGSSCLIQTLGTLPNLF